MYTKSYYKSQLGKRYSNKIFQKSSKKIHSRRCAYKDYYKYEYDVYDGNYPEYREYEDKENDANLINTPKVQRKKHQKKPKKYSVATIPYNKFEDENINHKSKSNNKILDMTKQNENNNPSKECNNNKKENNNKKSYNRAGSFGEFEGIKKSESLASIASPDEDNHFEFSPSSKGNEHLLKEQSNSKSTVNNTMSEDNISILDSRTNTNSKEDKRSTNKKSQNVDVIFGGDNDNDNAGMKPKEKTTLNFNKYAQISMNPLRCFSTTNIDFIGNNNNKYSGIFQTLPINDNQNNFNLNKLNSDTNINQNQNSYSSSNYYSSYMKMENTEILSVKVKISETNTSIFKLRRYDDLFLTIKMFCEINKIDEMLLKPLIFKSLAALNKIYQLYNTKLSSKEVERLKLIKNLYDVENYKLV